MVRGTIRLLWKKRLPARSFELPRQRIRRLPQRRLRFHDPPELYPKLDNALYFCCESSTISNERRKKQQQYSASAPGSYGEDNQSVVPVKNVEVRSNIPVFERGLFATKNLACGDLVIEERPFMKFGWDRLTERDDPRNMVKRFKLENVQPEFRWLASCIIEAFALAKRQGTNDPLELAEFKSLSRAQNPLQEHIEALRRQILPVVHRNFNKKYQMDQLLQLYSKVMSNAYRDGVYQTISIINHSCLPNVCWRPFQTASGQLVFSKMSIVALFPITKGEQIFINYSDYEGFDLSIPGSLGVRCANDPDDFNATISCLCCAGREESALRKSFDSSA